MNQFTTEDTEGSEGKTRINTDKRRLKDCSSLSYIFSFPLRKSALILRFNKDLNSVELRVTLW